MQSTTQVLTKQANPQAPTYKISIEVYKHNSKDNITFNTKYNVDKDQKSGVKVVNITGSCVGAEGLIANNGTNLGEQIKGKRTTLAFDKDLAVALLKEAKQLYAARGEAGDKNPVVNIVVECQRVTPLTNTIYVANIINYELVAAQGVLDADIFGALNDFNTQVENQKQSKNGVIANLITKLAAQVGIQLQNAES